MYKYYVLFVVLIAVTVQPVRAQQDASTIMAKAEKQAVKQDKNVFLIFHASWCGWCKRMDKKMAAASTKDYFDQNFVITHVTVLENKEHKDLENPGGMKLMKKYKGQKAGLPFWVILDKNGKLLTSSFNESGSNLGCPATKDEVAAFIKKLKLTTDISSEDQTAVADAFVLKR